MVENKNTEIPKKDRIIAILGPTASGKTSRAVDLAKFIGAEIISADSRQVYKGMDIGTGKDIEEYEEIPYHLIDICKAGEKYNLHKYLRDFRHVLSDIESRGKRVVVCGGTGMYIEAALSGIIMPQVPENPELRERLKDKNLQELTTILSNYKKLHNTTDVDTIKRALRAIEIEEYYRNNPSEASLSDRKNSKPLNSLIIGIDISRDERRKRISQRLMKRLDEGMVEEIRQLMNNGISEEDLIYYGLEYKYLTLYVVGKITYEEMIRELEIAIHQFAKRQMTWFRGMERRGFTIHWLDYNMPKDEFIETILKL